MSSWSLQYFRSHCPRRPYSLPVGECCVRQVLRGRGRIDIANAYIWDATRQVPATNGYPPNSGGRTRTRHRVTRLLRGPEPGPPGTRTTYGPVYGRQAGLTNGLGRTDSISLGEPLRSFKAYQSLPSQNPPLVFRSNEPCYLKFFLVGGSPNRLGHVVAH